MKLKYILYILSALILAIVATLVEFSNDEEEGEENSANNVPHEAPYDIRARHRWEQLRFMDPATGKIPKHIRSREIAYLQNMPGSYNRIDSKMDYQLSGEWSLRGPYNIGGRTRALALDIMNEDFILAGGVSGGMWKSTDGGKNWDKKTAPSQLHSVSCLAQDTRVGKENIWYYGTGEFWGNSAHLNGNGIYKSTDAGESWFPLDSTTNATPNSWDSPFEYVWRVITNHKNLNEDEVFAATCLGGIYRSKDGGHSWKLVLGGWGNLYSYFTEITITPKGVLYASLSERGPQASSVVRGIFRSLDGETWTDITPQFMPAKYNRIIIAAAPSDENQVYCLAETPGSGTLTINSRGDSLWHSFWKYSYVSGDGTGSGGIWEDRSQNIPAGSVTRRQFNSQSSYDLVMKVKPNNPEIVFFGGTNLYRTTDGLRTSTNTTLIGGYCPFDDPSPCIYAFQYPNHHADQHEILFSRTNPDILYTGSDGGIHKTLNNMDGIISWISLNNGYYTTQFYSCAIDHASSSPEIIGGLQDNGTLYTKWADPNKNWTFPTFSDGFNCAIADNGEYYYSSNNSSYQPYIKIWRYKLDINGERDIATRIDPIGGKDFIWNNPFKLDPNNSNIMYCAGGKILWRNNDLEGIPYEDTKDSTAVEWDSLNLPGVTMAADEFVSAIEISRNPANIVYIGTERGQIFRLDNANAGNPVPVNIKAQGMPSANLGCLTSDPADAGRTIAVYTGYNVQSIFLTTDFGATWAPISGNLEQNDNGSGDGPSVLWAEFLPVAGGYRYFAGTSAGLYSTSYLDGKYTVWKQESPGLIGNSVINMIDSRESDGFIAVATHGVGMYSAYITDFFAAPQAPALSLPINDAGNIHQSVDLSWEPVPEAGMYKLQVAKDINFTEIVYEKDGIRGTTHTASKIDAGNISYYWRVFARSSGGISKPSEVWKFVSSLTPPLLLYPEKGKDSLQSEVVLQWEKVGGADYYSVQLSSNMIFTDILLDTSGIIETACAINKLQNNSKYYWRVSSGSKDGYGDFSKSFNFTVKYPAPVEDNNSNTIVDINCYPNPFYDKTEFKFNVLKPGRATLSIHDVAGKEVITLIDGYLPAGLNRVKFEPYGLQSGSYFYKLSSGGRIITGIIKYVK